MLKCKEVSHIVAEDLDLGFWGRLQLKMHLLMCVHCRRYTDQIRRLGLGARRQLDETPTGEQAKRMEDCILDRICPHGPGDHGGPNP